MRKKTSQDKFIVRSRRMLIYTFLLILVFMYISAKAEMRKTQGIDGDLAAGGTAQAVEMDGAAGMTEIPERSEMPEMPEMVKTVAGMTETPKTPEMHENVEKGRSADGKIGDENGGQAGGNSNIRGDGEANEVNDNNEGDTSPVIRSEDMWALILTNAKYPIPEDYSAELKTLPGTEQSVDARIFDATVQMLTDMREQGLRPIVCSAYRTLDRQEILFNRKVKSLVKRGNTMEDAYKEAQHVLSIPGSGEHCLGLAVDIFSQSYQKLEEGFENTKEGKWLREHCAEYGFILRYEKGKEEITGINYEPWHFRYVGVEAAEYMMDKGISLEEFYIEESLFG